MVLTFCVGTDFTRKQAAWIYRWLQDATSGDTVRDFLKELRTNTFYITNTKE